MSLLLLTTGTGGSSTVTATWSSTGQSTTSFSGAFNIVTSGIQYVTAGYWVSGYVIGNGSSTIDPVAGDPQALPAIMQDLNPGAIIELFQLDLASISNGLEDILYFCPSGPNELGGQVVWQGQKYVSYPIEATGFQWTGKGPIPRPMLKASNVTGTITYLLLAYKDLVGAKVTRKRTLVRYLDAVNFAGGNASADPDAAFSDDVYYIRRKVSENKQMVELELGSSMDVQGIMIPLRQIIANVCTWKYRATECSYTGGAVAKADDTATGDITQDVCGKRLSSCKIRFGANAQLPYGSMPGAGLIGR